MGTNRARCSAFKVLGSDCSGTSPHIGGCQLNMMMVICRVIAKYPWDLLNSVTQTQKISSTCLNVSRSQCMTIFRWQLLLYLLLSFFLSLSWVLLLSCCAKPTVWLSLLISTIGLSLILAFHSYNRYEALLQVLKRFLSIVLVIIAKKGD